MTWIANGESGASVRAKLNSLWVPISSGSISTPIAYLDVILPSGYMLFSFYGAGWAMDTDFQDALSGVFSRDGGSTFLIGGSTYTDTGFNAQHQEPSGPSTVQATGGADGVFYICPAPVAGNGDNPNGFSCTLIDPGSDSSSPTVSGENISAFKYDGAANATLQWYTIASFLTDNSVGRVDLMRIMPLGNEDIPPTSGENIIAGKWALFGLPG